MDSRQLSFTVENQRSPELQALAAVIKQAKGDAGGLKVGSSVPATVRRCSKEVEPSGAAVGKKTLPAVGFKQNMRPIVVD